MQSQGQPMLFGHLTKTRQDVLHQVSVNNDESHVEAIMVWELIYILYI